MSQALPLLFKPLGLFVATSKNMIDNTLYLRVSLVMLFADIGVALTIWCHSRSAPPAKSKRLSGPARDSG